MTAPVVLLWGEQPFLLREAALEELGDIRPEELDARDWRLGALGDLATPSLFGEPRALVVTNAQEIGEAGLEEVRGYASAPSPDARLLLLYGVGPRAKGPPKRFVQALGDATEVRHVAVERRELAGWVLARARRRGVPATPKGAAALVETLGEDPGALDQAVVQLAGSHAAEGLTPDTVAAQFRGFGERRVWELCDAAFAGDLVGAVRVLAGLLDAGDEPLVILGGIASRLRDLIRVRSLPPGTPQREVARAAGLRFDWQARRYVEQSRRFPDGELESIHADVVEADRLLKQGGTGDVVLPGLVSRIAGGAQAGRGARRGAS